MKISLSFSIAAKGWEHRAVSGDPVEADALGKAVLMSAFDPEPSFRQSDCRRGV